MRKPGHNISARQRLFEPHHHINAAPELHGEPYITDGGRTRIWFHKGKDRDEAIASFEAKRGLVIIGVHERKVS